MCVTSKYKSAAICDTSYESLICGQAGMVMGWEGVSCTIYSKKEGSSYNRLNLEQPGVLHLLPRTYAVYVG